MKELTGKEKKYLRGLAHALNPVVIIGKNGFSEQIEAQIDEALTAHELIKIKFIDYIDEKNSSALRHVRILPLYAINTIGL